MENNFKIHDGQTLQIKCECTMPFFYFDVTTGLATCAALGKNRRYVRNPK